MGNLRRKALTATTAICAAFIAFSVEAHANGTKPVARQSLFDIETRKKTKSALIDGVTYGAYVNARFIGERNRRLDDGVTDGSDEIAGYAGLALRADLSGALTAFGHGEARINRTTRRTRPTTEVAEAEIKEALVSYQLSETAAVSAGRMRLSDSERWIIDTSIDGLHFSHIRGGQVLEIAASTDAFEGESTLLIAHAGQVEDDRALHGYAVAETTAKEQRLHLAAAWSHSPSDRLSYTFNAGALLGDAANGEAAGFGFDIRATHTVSAHEWNPQITLGVAAGAPGFAQSEFHTNKTYDGGQMQFHRYGYVFQPELTNMAVGTASVGIRPSRALSVDLGFHAYAQIDRRTETPDARVRGKTTGGSHLLGAEVSLVGAWRPTRKTKFEVGAGVFQAGPAYADRSSATRVFTRFSIYF